MRPKSLDHLGADSGIIMHRRHEESAMAIREIILLRHAHADSAMPGQDDEVIPSCPA